MKAATPASADWRSRWEQLVRQVARVLTARGEEQLVDSLARPAEPRVIAFVNAHAMNSTVHDESFFNALASADILLRDGIGMAILMKLLNQPPGLNLNGTDLIPKIIARYPGKTIALFGTQEPWLERAREVIETRVAPGSHCVTAHGFHDTQEYLKLAAQHRPPLIVLGMGMPRQEEVASVLRAALGYPCAIVCGGAIIDFLGNKTSRAPLWMRKTGLEWAYRLALEPKRLFKRYVLGNPVFIARSLRLAGDSLLAGQRGRAA